MYKHHYQLTHYVTNAHVSHLSLREPHVVCQLRLPPDCDVPAVVELLLQLEPLVVAVHHPVLVLGAGATCNSGEKHSVNNLHTHRYSCLDWRKFQRQIREEATYFLFVPLLAINTAGPGGL